MPTDDDPSARGPIKGWFVVLLGIMLAVVVVIAIGLMFGVHPGSSTGSGMMDYWGGTSGWMASMAALMMLGFLVFVLLVVLLVAAAAYRPSPPVAVLAPQDPGSILRERFARGEITHEQFEQISKDLSLRS